MTGAIEVDALTHHYGSGAARRRILNRAAMSIKAAEIVVLTGPSGSGKTTLLTLIGALRRIQDGDIRLLGTSLKSAGDRELRAIRHRTRFVFQKYNLIGALTARGNVEAGLAVTPESDRHWDRSRAEAALVSVGLGDKLHAYPDELSGGQQQRVAVARAIACLPDILIADEPTAALDAESGRIVIELIRNLASKLGCSVLIASHDERVFGYADRRMHIEDGSISEVGL